ncbi:sulfite exporter TauE/SafE family protein [Salmonella enterica subsp. enterica serovar Saintpaul]|nr:sulfite exporter TauE/SafE family protein [Salmonella enterica subsp. enterica serovar Saintpaul]EFR6822730.1 sulfite exporter TauE/SafE family protein [Salmonella enterica]EHF6859296.1 sulfite exporter TauE/SafE family protein [Salmonella enterica subsp. enterica serovar Panama]ELS1935947.1 sulfite exporter TauE/SafE family protein [Salmonella enterica]
MSEQLNIYLLLIFILAGFVKGVTGMGLPTVSMGLLGMFMPLPIAAALLVIPSFVTNVLQLFNGPSVMLIISRLWLMMLLILAGTVAASSLLISINPSWSAFGLGMALIIYAVFALVSPSLTVSQAREKWLSSVIGGVTGVITGATGVFVMPAVPFLQSLRLSKDELVQALGLSFTVSTVALATGLYLHDAFKLEQFSLSFLSIFPALAGMWLGQKVRARISDRLFRKCFLLFLIVLGMELISRPFT